MVKAKSAAKPKVKAKAPAKAKAKPAKPAKSKVKAKTKPKVKAKPHTQDELPPAVPALLLEALMALCAQQGWADLSFEDILGQAGVSAAEAADYASSKLDVLFLLGEQIDAAMLDGEPAEGSAKDKLFDLIMRRFDALQLYRDGALAIMHDAPRDPLLAPRLLPSFRQSLSLILQEADIEPTPLRVLGLGALSLAVLQAWRSDDSADMTKTMAALDNRLDQLEKLAQLLQPLTKATSNIHM
jgi:hypothetical protein